MRQDGPTKVKSAGQRRFPKVERAGIEPATYGALDASGRMVRCYESGYPGKMLSA